jgi:hypothetical protein
MQRMIYGPGKPYIKEDERKLSESDLKEIASPLKSTQFEKHFDFVVTRLIPDRFDVLNKANALLLVLLWPIGRFLAVRLLFSARIGKPEKKIAIAA